MAEIDQTAKSEMSLRAAIEALWRGKIIIAIVTVIAIISSIIINIFFTPTIYSASTVIQVTPFNLSVNTNQNDDSKIIEMLTQLPSMTIDSYLQQVLSVTVLNDTIKALDLKNEDGTFMTAGDLSGMITVRNLPNTNIIEIVCNNSDPEQSARIVNTLVEKYILYINNTTKQLCQQVVDLISVQMAKEEDNIRIKSQALSEYLKNGKSVTVMQAEVDKLVEQIVKYETELNETELQINKDSAILQAMHDSLSATQGIDLSEFQLLVELESVQGQPANQLQINLGTDDLTLALIKIEFNKTQSRLLSNISLNSALIDSIEKMNEDLTAKTTQLNEEKFNYNILNRDLEIAQNMYSAYKQKYRETLLITEADIGKNKISVTKIAIPSYAPLSTNKLLKIILAAAFGFALGIFIVLFRDYWQKNKID